MRQILNLQEVLDRLSAEERHELLIVRGWQLQRAEAQTDERRAFCDWMMTRGWLEPKDVKK